MTRIQRMLAVALGAGLAGCVTLAVAAPPNIIVMVVDDMGVMDTSVPFLTDEHGEPVRHPLNEFYRTPSMERLAARGTRFSQFCAMSVCSPSRISLMTGQNAARHGTTNWINPETDNAGPSGPRDWNWRGLGKQSVTLPRLLQHAGYRTIHVGKGHFGPRGSEGSDPRNLGFDVNVGGASIGQPGSYYGKKNYGAGPKATHAVPGLEKYHGSATFLTDALTQEAKAHVSAAVDDGKPFFLHFAQYAVHAPFEADPRFAPHYASSGKAVQAQAFATLIEGMDASLGEMIDHCVSLGVAEDTLIVFLGDNGSDAPLGGAHEVACAAPLRGKKGSHYEGGMRAPLIVAWAAPAPNRPHQQRLPAPAGAVQSRIAAVHDLFPTILAVAGLNAPPGHTVDGEPLDELLGGRPAAPRRGSFLMHYPHAPHRSDYFTAFRTDDWKVVYHYFPSAGSEGARYQVFHLKSDPFESINLAPSQPAELRRLMEQLTSALEAHRARYPVAGDGVTPLKPVMP